MAIRRYLEYAAVVIDHGLQDGSGDVAASVEQQLARLGYDDVTVTTVEVDQSAAAGPEAAAREARYRALDAEARARSATVLIGHTLDDQAETVLLGLARGSGSRSLAGMPPRAGHLLRPFLHLRRETTEQACAEQGLDPWQDPHNTDRRFTRCGYARPCCPRWRPSSVPALPKPWPGLRSCCATTPRCSIGLPRRHTARRRARRHGHFGLRRPGIPTAALRRRILRLWLLAHGIGDLTLRHISAVESLVIGWHGQKSIRYPGQLSRATRDGFGSADPPGATLLPGPRGR